MIRTAPTNKQMTLRRAAEGNALGYNKYLRNRIQAFAPVVLLRHVHPIDRIDYARRFHELRMITNIEARGFGIKTY